MVRADKGVLPEVAIHCAFVDDNEKRKKKLTLCLPLVMLFSIVLYPVFCLGFFCRARRPAPFS